MDFGGDVTRAMRAVDGAVVVVDAVEGTMPPQTETVLRQALKEGVRPVLFINKVDRLVNELKVDEQEMQIRLAKVIDKVNKLIKGMNEKMYNEAGSSMPRRAPSPSAPRSTTGPSPSPPS